MVTHFYGIGVGPGDSELLTVKAVKAIKRSKAIFVPMGKDGLPGVAYRIAADYIDLETPVVPLSFPMIPIGENDERLQKRWAENAALIALALKDGDVAFLTLGDPFLYSTYAYVLEYLKENYEDAGFMIETIPGVNAYSALSARIGVPLALGEESLGICSLTIPEEEVREIFRSHDNIIVMKALGKTEFLKEIITELGLENNFVLLSHIGMEGEKISNKLEDLEDIPYLSTVLIKKGYDFG